MSTSTSRLRGRPGRVDVRDERGDVIVGWLAKLVVVLGVVGVLGFDAISVGTATMGVEDDAASAARAGQDAWETTHTPQAAYEGALAQLQEIGSTSTVDPAEVLVTPTGDVTVTVHRTATTLVLERIPPLRHWAERSAVSTATPVR